MIFPNVKNEIWAKRYNIKPPLEILCGNCQTKLEFSIPVAYDSYRGFKTPSHGCPENFDQYYDVSVDKEEIENIKSLIS